jgi:hypothetical protein
LALKNKGKYMKLVILGMMAMVSLAASAQAETRVEKKLMQFGGPETRTRCINYLVTKGLPTCKIKSWKLKCKDTYIKTCSELATDFYQHKLYLVATGPDAQGAVREYLEKSLAFAVSAGAVAFLATPGEVAIKAAAAYAAFQTAIAVQLSKSAALSSLADGVKISIEDRGSW